MTGDSSQPRRETSNHVFLHRTTRSLTRPFDDHRGVREPWLSDTVIVYDVSFRDEHSWVESKSSRDSEALTVVYVRKHSGTVSHLNYLSKTHFAIHRTPTTSLIKTAQGRVFLLVYYSVVLSADSPLCLWFDIPHSFLPGKKETVKVTNKIHELLSVLWKRGGISLTTETRSKIYREKSRVQRITKTDVYQGNKEDIPGLSRDSKKTLVIYGGLWEIKWIIPLPVWRDVKRTHCGIHRVKLTFSTLPVVCFVLRYFLLR